MRMRFRSVSIQSIAASVALAVLVAATPAAAEVLPSPEPTVSPEASPSPEASDHPAVADETLPDDPRLGGASQAPVEADDVAPEVDDNRAVVDDAPETTEVPTVRGEAVMPSSDPLGDEPEPDPGIVVHLPEEGRELVDVGAAGSVDAAVEQHVPYLDLSTGDVSGVAGGYDAVFAVGESDLAEAVESRYTSGAGEDAITHGRADLLMAELPRASAGDEVTVDTVIPSGDVLPGAAFAFTVSMEAPESADAQWVEIGVDPTGVANASGANYLERLTLVAFPACALTTPDVPECMQGVPLGVERSPEGLMRATVPADAGDGLRLSGQVGAMGAGFQVGTPVRSGDLVGDLAASQGLAFSGAGGGTVVAAVAGAEGPSGSFKVTDLSVLGSWSVGEQTGAFNYSVPLSVPPVTAGPTPSLALSYSSAVVDGRSHARNGQAGLVGDGWSMGEAYIERVYLPCAQDFAKGTDVTDADHAEDKCWESPVEGELGESQLVLSMAGISGQLIWDGGNRYYSESNPDIRVTRYTHSGGASVNGDTAGEYFVVQTPDGGRHYFGYGRVPGSGEALADRPATQSVAVVPVFADDEGEPGFNEVTMRGYRYMLDIEMDVLGNAMVHTYLSDDNRYAVAGDPAQSTTYTRAIRPNTTDYGYLLADVDTVIEPAEARIDYVYEDRCHQDTNHLNPLMGDSVDCADLAVENRGDFPDTPVDLICDGTCASINSSATFFTTVRLSQVETFVKVDGSWGKVATHQLIQAFPHAPPESRTMWLDSVFTRGYANYDLDDYEDTYAIHFSGTMFDNRIDWLDGDFNKTKLKKRRITSIINEFGGEIEVDYYTETSSGVARVCPMDGAASSSYTDWLDGFDPKASTWNCYQEGEGDEASQYHRYLVAEVRLDDRVADSPTQTTRYDYLGEPAWAYGDNRLLDDGAPGRAWSDWRGYETVRASAVSEDGATTYSSVQSQYFRGLSHDYNGTDRETAVDLTRASDGKAIDDHADLRGRLASSTSYDGAGAVVGWSHDEYEILDLTDGVAGAEALEGASVVRIGSSTGFETEPGTSWSSTQTVNTSYTPENRVATSTATISSGTQAVTECSRFDYVDNITDAAGEPAGYFSPTSWGGKNYIVRDASVETFEGSCDAGILTSRTETYFDGAASPEDNTPTLGLPTEQKVWTGADATLSSRWTFDARGRQLTARGPSDIAAGTQVTTAYTRGADGVTKVATTNQLGHVSRAWIEPAHGNVIRQQSVNGDWTHYRYDAHGLFNAGWSPREHGQASAPSDSVVPTVLVEYDIYADGLATRVDPVAVMTAQHTGVDAGGNYICAAEACFVRRSYTFLDGFARVRQEHSVQPNGDAGRVIVDTEYNDRGLAVRTSAPFANALPAQFGHLDDDDVWSSGLFVPDYGTLVSYSETDHDWAGRPVSSRLMSLGAAVRGSSYTYLGDISRVTSPSGAVTETVSDVRGRLTDQYTHPESGFDRQTALHTSYSYLTMTTGVRTTVIDPDGFATTTETDLAGRKVSMDDPNAGLTAYTYDDVGRLESVASEAGTITYGYDALGRMLERTSVDPQGSTSSSAAWTYDPAGHLGAAATESAITVLVDGQTATVTTTLGYDALHRPTSSTVQLPTTELLGDLSGQSYTRSIGYDAIGQPTTVSLPAIGDLAGETVTTGYDTFGTAVKLTAGAQTLVDAVVLDDIGRVTSRTLGNGVTRALSWDPVDGSLEMAEAFYLDGGNPVHVQFDEYVRDGEGRLTGIVNHVTRDGGTPADTSDDMEAASCFAYDDFNRLEAAWTVNALAGGCEGAPTKADDFWSVGGEGFAQSWAYTPAGRVTEARQWSITDGVVQVADAAYAYDDVTSPHAVTSIADGTDADVFEYDSAGRTATRDVGGVEQTLHWDAVSNLVGVSVGGTNGSSVSFIYDASGQRVARIADTVTAYFGETEVTDPSAATAGSTLEGVRYYTLGRAMIAYRDGGGLTYMFGDVQGSATVTIADGDPTTATVSRNVYTPFGQTLVDGIGVERGWLGQTLDADTGLVYLNARYYDATAARFISPDPLWDPAKPTTLDPYAYAANNPVMFMDATGLCYGLDANQMAQCAMAHTYVDKAIERSKKIGTAKQIAESCFRRCGNKNRNLQEALAIPVPEYDKSNTKPRSGPGIPLSPRAAEAQVAELRDAAPAQRWAPPPPSGGLPVLDFETRCINWYHCALPRDVHNRDSVQANPGAYYEFGPKVPEIGLPAWADGIRNGAEVPIKVTTSAGSSVNVSTWSQFSAADQRSIYKGETSVGTCCGGGSIPPNKAALPLGGLEPSGGTPERFTGGTYANPGFSEWYGDGYSSYGGTFHPCSASYRISDLDARGLSQAELAFVVAYNTCP